MCRARPETTNTPMQALNLQNDTTFVEAARHLAERMLMQDGDDLAKIRHGWRLALVREPDEERRARRFRGVVVRSAKACGTGVRCGQRVLGHGLRSLVRVRGRHKALRAYWALQGASLRDGLSLGRRVRAASTRDTETKKRREEGQGAQPKGGDLAKRAFDNALAEVPG